MLFFIIAIVAIIAGIILSIVNDTWGPAIIAVILAVVLILMSCAAMVPTGHTGVITTFGKVMPASIWSSLGSRS